MKKIFLTLFLSEAAGFLVFFSFFIPLPPKLVYIAKYAKPQNASVTREKITTILISLHPHCSK
jgi:hypothetical protein